MDRMTRLARRLFGRLFGLSVDVLRWLLWLVWRTLSFKWRLAHSASRHPHGQAAAVAAAVAALLYLNYDPTLADVGAQSARRFPAASHEAAVARRPMTTASLSGGGNVLGDLSVEQQSLAGTLTGERALLLNLLLLERGHEKLSQCNDYLATFSKQERLDGELGEDQVMQLKVRHAPFSVYMKWLVGDEGRELLYVDGRHDGKMLIRVGGVKGRILPPLKLDPTGTLAMKEARHPVTKLGLLELARELIHYRRLDLKRGEGMCCAMLPDVTFDGRPCYCFQCEYQRRSVSELYRKSLVYVDKEHSLPVYIKNYTWPGENQQQLAAEALDEATLIECYGYADVRLDSQLADADFDRANKDYGFVRR